MRVCDEADQMWSETFSLLQFVFHTTTVMSNIRTATRQIPGSAGIKVTELGVGATFADPKDETKHRARSNRRGK